MKYIQTVAIVNFLSLKYSDDEYVKMMFSMNNFFSKCDQIRRKLLYHGGKFLNNCRMFRSI